MKLKNISELIRSEFVKNALTLVSGTTIAQIINFALSPILTRLYTLEDFGVLATFMAITSIIGAVSSLRYEMAILLPKEESESYSVIALSLLINVIFVIITVASLVIFWIFAKQTLTLFSSSYIYMLIPVSIFLTGAVQIFSFWSLRLKQFKKNALARIGNSTSNMSFGLLLGIFIQGGGIGLILAYLLSMVANILILTFGSLKTVQHNLAKVKINHLKLRAKQYQKYPLINTPHALVGAFKDSGIIFLIKEMFGQSILGSYSFAYRILSIPTSVISSSISQVFYQKAASMKNEGKSIKSLLISIYKFTALIGLPFFIVFYFIAPDVFAFVFSEKYRVAGKIASFLLPWIYANFVASSASFLPLLYNKLLVPFLFSISDIFFQILAISVGFYYKNYVIAFLLMGCMGMLNTIISFFWVFYIVNKTAKYGYSV